MRTVSHVVPDVTGEVCQEPLLADAIERPRQMCAVSHMDTPFPAWRVTFAKRCAWERGGLEHAVGTAGIGGSGRGLEGA